MKLGASFSFSTGLIAKGSTGMTKAITRRGVLAAGAAGAAVLASRAAGALNMNEEKLVLAKEWDKTFALSPRVDHSKVTFRNRFGITLAADLYKPKGASGKLPAISVCGPFGAVKEQSSGLYAQQMAERGFLAIAFDPSYTGESGGFPRNVASMDLNTEDFMASVDFLSNRADVDPEKIGIIGICGWGGICLNAAELDPRIRATASITPYDMPRVTANGYFDKGTAAGREEALKAIAAQRTADYRAGTFKRAGGVVDPLPADAPEFVKRYYDYYKTPRGYHKRSLNSNAGWNSTGLQNLFNSELLVHPEDLRSAVLMVHGSKAHSLYMGKGLFKKLSGGNKEFLEIPGADHTDLYDNLKVIPFERLEAFFRKYLKA